MTKVGIKNAYKGMRVIDSQGKVGIIHNCVEMGNVEVMLDDGRKNYYDLSENSRKYNLYYISRKV